MNRLVLDTNILISAALRPQSVPRQAVNLALLQGRILFSSATWEEIEGVIVRPKFDGYITDGERREFLANLAAASERVPITEHCRVCRDPRDDKFLEVAVSGGASCIVTGDEDLLVLHPFRGIPILTPKGFLSAWSG